MNKVISMSLWGSLPRYSLGAIKNAELARTIFPDWRVRIYHAADVNKEHLAELANCTNVDLYDFSNHPEIAPCFWRFFAAFESDDTIMLSRDTDSRLSVREKGCIESWLKREEKYSVIRDHPRHYDFPMLAGMWGFKGKMPDEFLNQLFDYSTHQFYSIDQLYLRDIVWPEAQRSCYISGIHEESELGLSRNSILPHFIGQGYDEHDTPLYPSE